MADPGDVDRVDEKADHDRGRREQHVVQEPGRGGEPAVAAVLGEIGARENAHRRAKQGSRDHHDEAAADRVGEAAVGARRRRHLVVERRARERVAALVEQRTENPRQPEQAERDRQRRNRQHGEVGALAAAVERAGGAHVWRPSCFARLISRNLESPSTMVVIRKRIKPSSISAEKYKSPTASVNSFASAEAMLLPGAISEVARRCALPMTKVTAMVSPSARPRPSMMPPITPTLV